MEALKDVPFVRLFLAQQSWIRALDSKFKICSKKLTNFRICYKGLFSPLQQGDGDAAAGDQQDHAGRENGLVILHH
jgi:hypothetical protein